MRREEGAEGEGGKEPIRTYQVKAMWRDQAMSGWGCMVAGCLPEERGW